MKVINLLPDYAFPEDYSELDLDRFIAIMDVDFNHKPKHIKEMDDMKSNTKRNKAFKAMDETQEVEYIEFCKKALCALGGVPKEWEDLDDLKVPVLPLSGGIKKKDIDALNAAEIMVLYDNLVNVNFIHEENKRFRGFEVNGKKFELEMTAFASDLVLNVDFGEYAEAVQMKKHFLDNEGKKNHWEIFPDIMAIICRPVDAKGEKKPYNASQMSNNKLFRKCNMEDVLNVSFFLNKHIAILMKNTQTSLEAKNLVKNIVTANRLNLRSLKTD